MMPIIVEEAFTIENFKTFLTAQAWDNSHAEFDQSQQHTCSLAAYARSLGYLEPKFNYDLSGSWFTYFDSPICRHSDIRQLPNWTRSFQKVAHNMCISSVRGLISLLNSIESYPDQVVALEGTTS